MRYRFGSTKRTVGVAFGDDLQNGAAVWNQPYLETCCRAALHRLHLCERDGRPVGQMDAPCQKRLAAMGLCTIVADGRCRITEAGRQRHATEVLKQARPPDLSTV